MSDRRPWYTGSCPFRPRPSHAGRPPQRPRNKVWVAWSIACLLPGLAPGSAAQKGAVAARGPAVFSISRKCDRLQPSLRRKIFRLLPRLAPVSAAKDEAPVAHSPSVLGISGKSDRTEAHLVDGPACLAPSNSCVAAGQQRARVPHGPPVLPVSRERDRKDILPSGNPHALPRLASADGAQKRAIIAPDPAALSVGREHD